MTPAAARSAATGRPVSLLRGLVSTSALYVWAALLLGTGVLLTFLVAPVDASGLGFTQKIFYFHAPIAETALIAFAVAFVAAVLRLIRPAAASPAGLEVAAVRLGLFFSGLVMVTGMVWGRAAWGVWWAWEPRLTTFLMALLVYAAYFVVRGSIDDEQRRETIGSVYAIIAFVTVPVTFFATRYLPEGLHPVVMTASEARMETSMALTFAVCTLGMVALLAALLRSEMALAAGAEALDEVKDLLEER
jgi:heme exporter protein C